MTTLVILLAALLAGLTTVAVHPSGVSGGGPVTGPAVAGSATVDTVIGGGPSGSPQP